jgi:transposase
MAENCKIKFKSNRRLKDEQKKSIEERKRVNKLHFEYDIPKSEITRKEGVSRGFVNNWTKSPDQDFTRDERGWPKKPFTQASIEGSNSVFSRKFWNRLKFSSVKEVDEKLKLFNESSRVYTGYEPPGREEEDRKDFKPKVYFLRQVKEDDKGGFIDVLHENIYLPDSYINYFVLAEWDLEKEQLYVRFEREKESEIIKRLTFKINQRSKKKCKDILTN